MSDQPNRFVIPSGTDLTLDPDVLPFLPGRNFVESKKPMWSTDRNESVSGRETRRQLWSYPRWSFELSHEFLRNSVETNELVKVLAFFNAHAGGYKEFLYRDDEDYAVTDQAFGVGDGTTLEWKLTRTINTGSITFTEPVHGLYGIPAVTVNGVAKVHPSDFVVSGDYAKITFATPPANGTVLRWTGEFFFVCRFDEDELDFKQMVSRLWENRSLTFTSVKP